MALDNKILRVLKDCDEAKRKGAKNRFDSLPFAYTQKGETSQSLAFENLQYISIKNVWCIG